MKKIKIAFFNADNVKESILFQLIQSLSKKKIEIVNPESADLLILGPSDYFSFQRRCLNIFRKKIKFLDSAFPNLDIYSLKRNYRPIRLFVNYENFMTTDFKCDFYITSSLGVVDQNHFRFAHWKDNVDWSQQEFAKTNNGFLNRFGSFYNLDDFVRPQGNSFLKKNRKFCFFTSHFNEPRRSLFTQISKSFTVDGYGPYFDKNLNTHNNKKFTKKEIMKDYSFNLCPENSLYPGYYTEKIPDAFFGKCLPVTWTDQNVDVDFNKKAFVNLLDYAKNNYMDICELLKDDNFLRKFTKEPLCFEKPNLLGEEKFINGLLSVF